jgi:hypothetical protein
LPHDQIAHIGIGRESERRRVHRLPFLTRIGPEPPLINANGIIILLMQYCNSKLLLY